MQCSLALRYSPFVLKYDSSFYAYETVIEMRCALT